MVSDSRNSREILYNLLATRTSIIDLEQYKEALHLFWREWDKSIKECPSISGLYSPAEQSEREVE
jgi:hypothetical protein